MGVRSFDRKFGREFLRELPATPAVYLFKDGDGRVLYAGKAKDVRRRLQTYRSAGRRKTHRKMRALVRAAASLEVRLQPSEREALLLENELIRTLRPPYNVDGAYSFLYPALGVGAREHQTLLCFTTRPEAYRELPLRWYGCFRSRLRAQAAFDALSELLGLVGHVEPRSRLPRAPRLRGSRLVALRRVPAELREACAAFLAGESRELLPALAHLLVERARARREAALVEERLRLLHDFYTRDVSRLREALRAAGRGPGFVAQDERDPLFIAARSGAGEAP